MLVYQRVDLSVRLTSMKISMKISISADGFVHFDLKISPVSLGSR